MIDYNPYDWYWIVSGSTSQVYSSRLGDYVPADDVTYRAWKTAGGLPTSIGSEADLGEVLAAYSLRPAAANVLDGYKEKQSRELTLAVVAKVLLWLVNEVRGLKGQQAITAAQFRSQVKDLM